MLSPGSKLGPYEIQDLLGSGGMGEVYRAKDARLGREVALKVLPAEIGKNTDAFRRFEREAKTLGQLCHPNILTVFDVGKDREISYVVTELLEGETLRSRIRTAGLPWQEGVRIAISTAEALAASHDKGIIHRDLKPENIFVTTDGRVKVLDFGLAHWSQKHNSQEVSMLPTESRLTQTGELMGTLPYMSPEQLIGKTPDTRSDIFSFGCLLYEILNGQHPFTGNTPAQRVAAILKDPPTGFPKEVRMPLALKEIILHCLQKAPENRFQSAHDLVFALQQVLNKSDKIYSSKITSTPRKKLFWSVPALVLVIFVVAIFVGIRPVQRIDSIAVLPFEDTTANPDLEYLSDGITEEIINHLSRLPDLKVMSRNTVFSYKGKKTEPEKVGQELHVRAVLMGKIGVRNDQLIIATELINTTDNSQIWGEKYIQPLKNSIVLQAEIAEQVVENLRFKLTPEEKKRLLKRNTSDIEAYNLYLKGRFSWNKLTIDNVEKGVEYFLDAISHDPNYALAYTGLADCYTYLGRPDDARLAIIRALELDDTLGEAHASLAFVNFLYDWNWTEAENHFKKALKLSPNYAEAYHWYAIFLSCMTRHEEALHFANRAIELDPMSLLMNTTPGLVFYMGRNYDRAMKEFLKILEMDPNALVGHSMLGSIYEKKRMFAQAIDEYDKLLKLAGDVPIAKAAVKARIAHAYALQGKETEALTILQEISGQWNGVPYFVAEAYAALGRKDEALKWLKKAYEQHDPQLITIKVAPWLDFLRSDPRFTEILRQMHLEGLNN